LKEIKDILDSASISNEELVGVQKDIDKISGVLADTTARLNDLDSDLASTKQAMMQGNSQLEYLRSDADKLKLNAQDMKDSITRLTLVMMLASWSSSVEEDTTLPLCFLF